MSISAELQTERRLFEARWDDLSDLELLALVLAPGASDAKAVSDSQRLLEHLQSIRRLPASSYADLRQAGLNHRRSLALIASANLFGRIQQEPLRPGQSFRSSLEIYRHFHPRMQYLKRECFWNVLLDGKNRILKIVRISEGSLTCSLAHPRDVYRPAIREAAAGVLFVHNHPSGDPAPSREDIQITRRLVETGKIVGIRALDHVIVGSETYFSFADQNML